VTTPIAPLQQAADYGLKLGIDQSGALTVKPARLCAPEFAEVLKAHEHKGGFKEWCERYIVKQKAAMR
jgi:hypothetical protein